MPINIYLKTIVAKYIRLSMKNSTYEFVFQWALSEVPAFHLVMMEMDTFLYYCLFHRGSFLAASMKALDFSDFFPYNCLGICVFGSDQSRTQPDDVGNNSRAQYAKMMI
jgi:hypothetical protein